MIRMFPASPNASDRRSRCGDHERLVARALGRFLLCGSWTATSGTLVRTLGASADTALIADTLTRAAAVWHGARAAIDRALGEAAGRDRTVALADALVDARERLGSWELVYALLERHAATPAGRALDPPLIDGALTLACAWYPENASGADDVRHAA